MRWFIVLFLAVGVPVCAQQPAKIGIVIMHGKGGSPNRYVSELASALQDKGVLVANLEMPWSGRRNYDVDVATAEREVRAALAGLRSQGATRVFAAGHSLGGTFAMYLGTRLALDGVIPIAPGGHSASQIFIQKLGPSLQEARQYVADGKGSEPQRLADFEGSRGLYPIVAVPAAYVTWFDPEGAMNQLRSAKAAKVPVLYISPTRDYPGLRKFKDVFFKELPAHRHTRLYEPDADHLNSPGASSAEILRWLREVADAAP